jgi:hypothetical protein
MIVDFTAEEMIYMLQVFESATIRLESMDITDAVAQKILQKLKVAQQESRIPSFVPLKYVKPPY